MLFSAKNLIFISGLVLLVMPLLPSDSFSQEPKINPLWAKIDQLSSDRTLNLGTGNSELQSLLPII